MILNVTPTEFRQIYEAIAHFRTHNGLCADADIASYMVNLYGCERFQSYKVVVINEVPSIPWNYPKVPRFEKE